MRKPAFALALLADLCALTVLAGAQTIAIDGHDQTFTPGPLERAGRVFVPLRGIFERLGATVVYSNGTINATGGDGRTVSVQIGSTLASVNGQPSDLDVAPFLVGSYAYVPLRFVSQALGARVGYDSGSDRVSISMGPAAAPPPAAMRAEVRLSDEQPARGANVTTRRPTIAANFDRAVNPNSVRVLLDGLDVTAGATRSQSGIVYAPPSPLQSMAHEVRIEGTDSAGAPFKQSWSFTTGSGPVAVVNFVSVSSPGDGSAVEGGFTVRGHTRPFARVRVTAGAIADAVPGLSFGTGSYTGDTSADANGDFAVNVSLRAMPGGSISVEAISTDSVSGETAQARIRLRVT